jgi:hypothetical protein
MFPLVLMAWAAMRLRSHRRFWELRNRRPMVAAAIMEDAMVKPVSEDVEVMVVVVVVVVVVAVEAVEDMEASENLTVMQAMEGV